MDKCQNLEGSCKSSKLSWILPNYVEVTHWLESKYAISTVLIRLFFPEGTGMFVTFITAQLNT